MLCSRVKKKRRRGTDDVTDSPRGSICLRNKLCPHGRAQVFYRHEGLLGWAYVVSSFPLSVVTNEVPARTALYKKAHRNLATLFCCVAAGEQRTARVST